MNTDHDISKSPPQADPFASKQSPDPTSAALPPRNGQHSIPSDLRTHSNSDLPVENAHINNHNDEQEPKHVGQAEGEMLNGAPEHMEGDTGENAPDGAGPSGNEMMSIEDSQEWMTDGDHELKRVKVYELIGSRWVDQGTAFCFGQFQDETNDAFLIARSEANYQDVILSTAIRSNDVYQRQQDTLIVWTEPDGVDYALSFQDPEGCSEVWSFILEVQRHMNGGEDNNILPSSSPLIGPEPTSVTTASIIRSGHLPQPQLGIIGEVERAIKALARTQNVKEHICEYIQHEEYIKSMIMVMHQAEDLESLENLHALCSLMQTILMLNDHSMYEHILEDDVFFGVVGMLEYDPEFPTHKANYREFLHQTSHFHQPIPIHDEAIQRKIHHTYRLQFLKDVVLARALDDSTFNVLNSCIIFNQIDIITHVQQDQNFLREVVRLYVDEDMLSGGGVRKKEEGEKEKVEDGANADNAPKVNGAPLANGPSTRSGSYAFAPPEKLTEDEIALRREVVLLIQQLCVMGKNVQLPARMALFRSLVDRGILFAVQWALSLPEKDEACKAMINAGGEILASLLDHDLNGVRGHVLKQVVAIEKEREAKKRGADKAETVLALVCRILASSRDLAVQSQVGDALKVLMDIPPNDSDTPLAAGAAAVKLYQRTKDDPGTERFLDFFYKNCIETLFKPFNDIPDYRIVTEPTITLTREKTNLYLYLCDLLCNFTIQHSFRSHFFVLSSNISIRLATLLRAREKHLRHSAFRFFRICIKLNNRNLQNHLMKYDVLKPIIELTLQESRRDNLVSASCQEFFEHIRRENIKDLIKHCMTKHEALIRKLAETPLGVHRFTSFIRRWEMNNEPLPLPEEKPDKMEPRMWPGQGRGIEAEEEDYFNADDEEEDFIQPISSQWIRGQGPPSPMQALKRKRRIAIGPKGFRPPNLTALRPPSLGMLVDYDEDEDILGGLSGPASDDLVSQRANVTSLEQTPPKSVTPTTPPAQIRIPASPKLSHRQIAPSMPPMRPLSDEEDDEEDNMLEALVRGRIGPPSPGVELSMGPMRPSEKRRRSTEDEDDGLLERLIKAKKPDLGGAPNHAVRTVPVKTGDDPPKKIKLKFGRTSLGAVVSSPSPTTPVPSETGAKDVDTG